MASKCEVDQCETKWASLRTNYVKKHKEIQSVPSGSAACVTQRWPYYSQMSFLNQFVKHRQTVDNLSFSSESPRDDFVVTEESRTLGETNLDETPVTIMERNIDSPSTVSSDESAPAYGKRKPPARARIQSEMVKLLRKTTEEMDRKQDRYDHFGALVASQLRTKTDEDATMRMKVLGNVLFSTEISVVNYGNST